MLAIMFYVAWIFMAGVAYYFVAKYYVADIGRPLDVNENVFMGVLFIVCLGFWVVILFFYCLYLFGKIVSNLLLK